MRDPISPWSGSVCRTLADDPSYARSVSLRHLLPRASGASLSPLLAALHHSHAVLRSLATTLLAPSCSFTAGKEALEAWLREGAFEEGWRFGLLSGAGGVGGGGGGRREWAECMGVEVRGWDEAFRFGAR